MKSKNEAAFQPANSNKQVIIYLIRAALLLIFLIVCIFFPTVHSFGKLIAVMHFLLVPVLLEMVALVLKCLYADTKKNIYNNISVALRVLIVVVVALSLISFGKSYNDRNFSKAQSIYNTLNSEALIGIPENSNTKYVEDTYNNFDERPPIKKSDYAVIGRVFNFGKRLDIKLSKDGENVETTLETDFEYIDNIPSIFNGFAKQMSVKDVKKQYNKTYSDCWKEYKTDDGYTCLTYYQNRKHEGQNMYSLIVVGNGKLLALNLNTFLSEKPFNFDDMNIEEYYIDFLRNN